MSILTLLLLFVIFAITVHAQESTNKILSRFEIVAGPTISKNSGYLSDYGAKAGYAVGLGYYQKVYKSLSVNFRTLYEAKGSSSVYNYGLTNLNGTIEMTDKYTTNFKYLSFYALPTWQFGVKKNIYISAGGYYSALQKLSVNTYSTNSATGEFISERTNTDKNYFNPKFDAGVSFSVGYSFKLTGKTQFLLQAFSNRGLVDLHNAAFGSQRNNTFGIMLSLRMR